MRPSHHSGSTSEPRAVAGARPLRLRLLARVKALLPHGSRTQAACCYALPFVPALIALACVRDSRYVRAHAARAVFFYGAIVVAQVGLLLWLIVLGSVVTDGWPAVVLGLLFYLAAAALGVGALIWWLRALADGLAGRAVRPIGLGWPALRLERWLWARTAGFTAPKKNDTL